MQDIAVTRSYRLTKLRWWINNVNKYEELYPHLSRNKAFTSNLLENSAAGKKTEKEEQTEEQRQQQPSFAEKLRYNILTLLFSKPKESDVIYSYDPYYAGDYDEEEKTSLSLHIKSGANITDGTVVEKGDEAQEFNKEVVGKL